MAHGWVSDQELPELAKPFKKSGYGKCIAHLADNRAEGARNA